MAAIHRANASWVGSTPDMSVISVIAIAPHVDQGSPSEIPLWFQVAHQKAYLITTPNVWTLRSCLHDASGQWPAHPHRERPNRAKDTPSRSVACPSNGSGSFSNNLSRVRSDWDQSTRDRCTRRTALMLSNLWWAGTSSGSTPSERNVSIRDIAVFNSRCFTSCGKKC
jgi:hypothetical protein